VERRNPFLEKGIFILAPMVGRRSTKNVATDEPSEDATTEGSADAVRIPAVYVFADYLVICGRASERPMQPASATLESPLDSNNLNIARYPLRRKATALAV
jgi:hypothetical protein